MRSLRAAFSAMALVYAVACGGGISPATPGGGSSSNDSGADTSPAPTADAAPPTADVAPQTVDAGVDSSAPPLLPADGGIDAASFPDATFICDFQPCSVYTEFCGHIPVGKSGPICMLLPAECLADRTCACLLDAGLVTAIGPCTVGDAGELIITVP
jgi:hypothetical protein